MKWRKYQQHTGQNVINYGTFEVMPGASANMLGALSGASLRQVAGPVPPAVVFGAYALALGGHLAGAFAGGYLARRNKWSGVTLGAVLGGGIGGFAGASLGGMLVTANQPEG